MKAAHVGLFLMLEDVHMVSWEELEVKIREVLKDALNLDDPSIDSINVSFEECVGLEDDDNGSALPMPGG